MTTMEFCTRLILAIGMIWFILVFLLVIHEYGHMAVCNALNIKAEKLVVGWPVVVRTTVGGLPHEFGLLPLFGYVASRSMETQSLGKRALWTAAGPVTSAALGFLLLAIDHIYPAWMVNLAGHASLTLAAVNLIPLPPFDGWPIFQYGLAKAGISVSKKAQLVLQSVGLAAIGLSALAVQRFGGL